MTGSPFETGTWFLPVDDPNGHLRRLACGDGLPPYQCLIELCDAIQEDEPWYEEVLAFCYPERRPVAADVVPLRPELVLIEGEAESVQVDVDVDVENLAA